MAQTIDTLLLLALPASGKSEVRTFLKSRGPEHMATRFGLGENVQLDDFPYVHLMRRVDETCIQTGHAPQFFQGIDKPFADARDWGTLIQLLNEDYAALTQGAPAVEAADAATQLLHRLDRASALVGLPKRLEALPQDVRAQVEDALGAEAHQLFLDLAAERPKTLDGKTVVIEFARGGPEGAALPLPSPYGYRYALSQLSPELLKRAAVLYIWVTPEESRRKNTERTDPNDPGSILNHGVPEVVMRNEYGQDDMQWLREQSGAENALRIEAHGQTFELPFAQLDNRDDLTSFVRGEIQAWPEDAVQALDDGLSVALRGLLK